MLVNQLFKCYIYNHSIKGKIAGSPEKHQLSLAGLRGGIQYMENVLAAISQHVFHVGRASFQVWQKCFL